MQPSHNRPKGLEMHYLCTHWDLPHPLLSASCFSLRLDVARYAFG